MICFFAPKDILQKIPLRSFFQKDNLFFSLSQENEKKCRDFNLPPFWRMAVSIEIWCTPNLARGLSMRTHFATVLLQYEFLQ